MVEVGKNAPVHSPHVCKACGRFLPGSVPEEERGHYFRARAWCQESELTRCALRLSRANDFQRIRNLGDLRGLELDRLGASYEQIRWVAGAAGHGDRWIAERERRHRALVELLEKYGSGKGPGVKRAWLALAASMPKVGRAAKRAERAEAK